MLNDQSLSQRVAGSTSQALNTKKESFSQRQKRNRQFLKMSHDLERSKTIVVPLKTSFSTTECHKPHLKNEKEFSSQPELVGKSLKKPSFATFESQNSNSRSELSLDKLQLDTSTDSLKFLETQRKSGQMERQEFMFQKLEEADQMKNAIYCQRCLPKSLLRLNSLQFPQILPMLYNENEDLGEDEDSNSLLSHQEISFLPHTSHKGEDKICQICLDEVTTPQLEIHLFCRHSFHSECIEVWLTGHKTCPLCKMDIKKEVGKRNNAFT